MTTRTLLTWLLAAIGAASLAIAFFIMSRAPAPAPIEEAPRPAATVREKTPQQRINEAWEAMELHARGFRHAPTAGAQKP
jgi:hypothetical protein